MSVAAPEASSWSVRSALRDTYYGLESWLHPARRWLAERGLERRPAPASVLFVCHGNVCRSPYAQFVFQSRLSPSARQRIRTQSAGFIGPGRQPPFEALQAALRQSVDMQSHTSELIEHSALRDADLVVVMAAEQARAFRAQFNSTSHVLVLGDLDPEPIARRTILDPWNQGPDVFDDCYTRVARCVARLVELLDGEHRGSAE